MIVQKIIEKEGNKYNRQPMRPSSSHKEMFEKSQFPLRSLSDGNDKVRTPLLRSQKIKANKENNKDILCTFSRCENSKLIKQGKCKS